MKKPSYALLDYAKHHSYIIFEDGFFYSPTKHNKISLEEFENRLQKCIKENNLQQWVDGFELLGPDNDGWV